MESFTLSDVGLVSGDLLHIIAEEEEVTRDGVGETSLEQQLLRMGFSKVCILIHPFVTNLTQLSKACISYFIDHLKL